MNRRRGVDDSSDEEDAPPRAASPEAGSADAEPAKASEPEPAGSNAASEDEGEGEAPDSSEEDSSDDEEELAKFREGFIADSDEDEENDEPKKRHRRKRHHRPASDEEENLQLDEDDLDLVREASGGPVRDDGKSRFKRLKKAGDSREAGRRGLNAMFDDDDEEEEEEEEPRPAAGSRRGEFDDFIEADEFSEDEEEALRREEERETGNRRAVAAAPGLGAVSADLAGLDLDEDKLGEIYDVFGDGAMYDWALAGEEDMEAAEAPAEDLSEVFEPSELAARMLTAEDNQIRVEDLPERYQLLRQRLRSVYDLGDDADYFEKKQWVAETFLESKAPAAEFRELTRQAVQHVVDFVALENLEVPFIWHHRQDYLVHFSDTTAEAVRTQLLTQDDLWKIIDLDLDYHALLEKRRAARDLASQVNANTDADFVSVEASAETAPEFQDLLEWLQFVHSATLRQARRHSRFGAYDRVRAGSTMELVDAMKLKPADVAAALASKSGSVVTGRDSALSPQELATELKASASDAEDFCSAALLFDPRIRRWFRQQFEQRARVDIVVTDDGRRKIDANSPYADIKYAANWTLEELRLRPALFLRMLQAEELGLVIVRVQFPNYKTTLYADFEETCGGKEDSEWAESRRRIAKGASRRVVPLITRGIVDTLRSSCVRALRDDVRSAFLERINQAPFKPAGYVIGTVPRVLAVTAGEANFTDAVIAVVVDEDGRLTEVAKLGDARASDFRRKLTELAQKTRPDVLGVAGFTPATRKLFQSVRQAVDEANIQTGPDDAEEPLQVVWVQDDVARLYRNSQKAANDFPELVSNARYCVALARYLQSPLLEHASLDSEQLLALPVHQHQSLLPTDDYMWAVETAFVDIVCLEGVDINLAVRSAYHASVLRYVAGLGPRKAGSVTQAIFGRAQGQVASRTQLVTSEITSKTVFMNCAAFLKIPWSSDGEEYLDATRVHPEDYDLARKMAADAQELDEEDIEAIEERKAGGVVYQLLEDDPDGRKLEDLVLEEYAEELESLFKQRKRCTLDHIRREIQEAYRELRKPLRQMSVDDVFTMLTGETRARLGAGSVCSAIVRRVTGSQLVLALDSGVDAVAESGSISDDRSVPLNQQFAPGQAVQAAVQSVDYANLFASVSTRQAAVVDAQRRLDALASNHDPQHWNQAAEDRDLDMVRRKTEQTQRQMRVIKHPLFRPISAKEAEAFLAPLQRGDLVIRPSSRGLDHLVVTWKVAEQIYQHIDVKELDKPNEYALGRSLQVGPYRYSDLDELIIMHVQTMARKVDEMTQSDKFQKGNKADVAKWLTAYTNARPNQSVYAFCFDHRRPGYFLLCFMLGANSPIREVHVKLLPNGYELMRNAYADVQGLCNGFKIMVQRSKA